ncbi:MAG: hypothetical protein ACLQUY_01355 [Ktedonobacterales bacterium]
MRLITYQAVLSQPNADRVEAARRDIERIGGRVALSPPNQVGLVIAQIQLPDIYRPEQVLPGVPFYPV